MATTNAIVCYRELGLGEEQRSKTTVQTGLTRHVIHNQDEHCSAPAQEEHIARGHAQFATTALCFPLLTSPPLIYTRGQSSRYGRLSSLQKTQNFPLLRRSTGETSSEISMNFPCPCCHRGSVVNGGSWLPSQTSDEFPRVCFSPLTSGAVLKNLFLVLVLAKCQGPVLY